MNLKKFPVNNQLPRLKLQFRRILPMKHRSALIGAVMAVSLVFLFTSCNQADTVQLGGDGTQTEGVIGVFIQIQQLSGDMNRGKLEKEFLKHLPDAVYEGNFHFQIVESEDEAQNLWGFLHIIYEEELMRSYEATLRLKTRDGVQTSWDQGVPISSYSSDTDKARARFWRALKNSPLIIYDPGNLSPALNSQGIKLWQYGPLSWDKPNSPVLRVGLAYIFTGKELLALDVETSDTLWQIRDKVLVVANKATLKRWIVDGSNIEESSCDESFIKSLESFMENDTEEELDMAEAELRRLPFFKSEDRENFAYCYSAPPYEWDGHRYWYQSGRYLDNWRVSDEIVYLNVGNIFTHETEIYALDRKTGLKLWEYPGSDFLLAEDTIYIRCSEFRKTDFRNGKTVYNVTVPMLVALDPVTGQVKWKSERGKADDIRLVSHGRVYMTDDAGYWLFGFDTAAVEKRWEVELDNFNSMYDAIVATSDTVYVQMTYGGPTHDILALDTNNGNQRWRFKTEACIRSVDAGNGLVYVVTDRDRLFALDAYTGKGKWSFTEAMYISHLNIIGTAETDTWEKTTEGDEPFGNLVVVGDTAYISHGAGLYCLNSRTGKKEWSYGTYEKAVTPVVYGDTVYLHQLVTGSRELVVALDARSGRRLWQFPVYSPANLLLIDDDILFITIANSVHAINPNTGKPGWYISLDGNIEAISEIVNGTICVASQDYVRAIK